VAAPAAAVAETINPTATFPIASAVLPWLGPIDRLYSWGSFPFPDSDGAVYPRAWATPRQMRVVRSRRKGDLFVVKLRVRSGESIQEAVRRFRKLCERSGLRKEMRRKAYYEKPSERRRREELKRLRKARQAARV